MRRSLKQWLSVMAVLCGTVVWAGEPGQEPFSKSTGVTTYVGDLSDDSAVQQVGCQECNENSPCSSKAKGFTSSCCDDSCDSIGGCDGCDGCGGCPPAGPGAWGRIDTLLWWAEDRDSPVLIANQANPAILPIPSAAGNPVFGGPIDSDLMFGNRIDFGRYFGEGDVVGIGARIFGLWDGRQSHSEVSTGTTSLGVPLNNAAGIGQPIGADGAFLIGFDAIGAPTPDFTGNVSASSELEFIGSEVYGRVNLGRGTEYQLDFISGYTFHNLDDAINLQGARTGFNLAGVANGTIFFQDNWDAENSFHGGQLGFESQVSKGRWMFSSLTKVHIGNMNQRLRVTGNSSVWTGDGNPGNGAVQLLALPTRGLLVQDNVGIAERDVFCFAPEANVKLGYRVNDCATMTIGYSFIMWSNVLLAGENIDDRIDLSRVGTALAKAITPPIRTFETETFFLHGLDLGLTFTY